MVQFVDGKTIIINTTGYLKSGNVIIEQNTIRTESGNLTISSGQIALGNVGITSGTISGIADLAVADGGTGASDAATARTNLGLIIGTNVQAYDATLAALAGVTTSANVLIYATGVDTFSTTSLTTFGRSLIDDADNSAARTTLGLGTISTQNSNSISISGGSISGITDLAVADGGTGASDAATARTNLGLVIGTNVQAYDATLAALAGVTTSANVLIYATGVDTFSTTSLTTFGRSLIDDADNSAARTTLGLGTISTQNSNSVSITGGTIDGVSIGNTSVATIVKVDNVTIDGNSVSASNTNGILIVSPNGTGSLQADSSGDARGLYAIDLQRDRSLNNQVASGNYSFIGGGLRNRSSGYASVVVGGYENTASGLYSFVGGGGREDNGNTASGTCSAVVGGQKNTSGGLSSIAAGGFFNTASGNYSVVGGGAYNNSGGSYVAVGGGLRNTSLGLFATVSGGYKNTSAVGSVSSGINNTANGGASVVSGGGIAGTFTVTIATPGVFTMNNHGLVANDTIRLETTGALPTGLSANTTYHVISTGLSDNDFRVSTTQGGSAVNTSGSQSGVHTLYSLTARNVASGNGSVIAGGINNTSSSHQSTVGGGRKNISTNSWSTVGGGRDNVSTGYVGTVGGGFNNSSTNFMSTVAGGHSNTSSGNYGAICGGIGNISGGVGSISKGLYAVATMYGQESHASGRFAASGDAQEITLIARRETTNNTANQVLFLDGSSSRLVIPAKTSWAFVIKLSAYNNTDNESGWWIIRGGIRRNAANGTALVGSLITESGFETSLNSASVSVVADDTNEALEIRVTGVTGKSIRWVAVIDASQVSY